MVDVPRSGDVDNAINIIERALSEASSTDEYLDAILRSNNELLKVMAGQSPEEDGGRALLPDDTAGLALTDVNQGDVVEFLYKSNGRTIISTVNAAKDIEEEGVAKWDANQGGLIPVSDADESDLDFGNVATAFGDPTSFRFLDTDFINQGQNVTVQPGDTETVLEGQVNEPSGLYEIGTNDETFTTYQYYIDGDKLLGEAIPKPLGLYNDRFEFPQPLLVSSSIKVEVNRDSAAGGPADYYSNAVLQ